MEQNFDAAIITSFAYPLKDILRDFYIVPEFQREFVWTEIEIEQLFSDIYDHFMENANYYFIGNVVVCKNADAYDLIDGQQRMTTIFLILCAFKSFLQSTDEATPDYLKQFISSSSILENGQEQTRFRINLKFEDSSNIIKIIANESEIGIDNYLATSASQNNIVNGYKSVLSLFKKNFNENVEGAKKYLAYCVNKVFLVRVVTPNVIQALQIFETINDRGIGLTPIDLLKNLLFMNSNKNDFEKLSKKWKELVDILYKNKVKPLVFLRYFIFANYKVEKPIQVSNIYSWILDNKKLMGYQNNSLVFVERLISEARYFVNLKAGKNIDGNSIKYLMNINKMCGSARQYLILLLAAKKFPTIYFKRLAHEIENLLFIIFMIREPARSFEAKFITWSNKIKECETTTDYEEIIKLINSEGQSYAQRFHFAFQALTDNSIPQYLLKYILAKYVLYSRDIAENSEDNPESNVTEFWKSNKCDIEHILPRSYKNQPSDEFSDQDETDSHIHKLGNLTLLEHSYNRSVLNKDFKEKIRYLKKSKFLFTRIIVSREDVGKDHAIIRAVNGFSSFDAWGKKAIEKRHEELLEIAHKIWSVQKENSATKID